MRLEDKNCRDVQIKKTRTSYHRPRVNYTQVHPQEQVTAQLTTVAVLPHMSSDPLMSFPSNDSLTSDGIPAKLGTAPVNKLEDTLNVFMVAIDNAGRVPVSWLVDTPKATSEDILAIDDGNAPVNALESNKKLEHKARLPTVDGIAPVSSLPMILMTVSCVHADKSDAGRGDANWWSLRTTTLILLS
jgi:hypothetical protein